MLYQCFLHDWLVLQSLTLPFTEDSGPLVLWAELLLDTTTGPGLWPREGIVLRVFTNLATSLLFSPVTPGRFTVTKLAMLTAGGEGKEGATLTSENHLSPTHYPMLFCRLLIHVSPSLGFEVWLDWPGGWPASCPSEVGCVAVGVVEVLGVDLVCWDWDCGTVLRMVRVAGMTVVKVLVVGLTGIVEPGLTGVIWENTCGTPTVGLTNCVPGAFKRETKRVPNLHQWAHL